MRYKLMYFADSVKVDLEIAGNCEMESTRSMAVLVGRTRQGGGRQRNCEEIGGGAGGGWRNSWLGRAIVRPSKPLYYPGYCLAVTR